MSNLAGLGIALLTIIAVCLLCVVVMWLFSLPGWIEDEIFRNDVHILWKIAFSIPWLVLKLFTAIFLVIGLLCGISLAKDFWKWFNH